MDPIQKKRSFSDWFRFSRLVTDRLFAFKIAIAGLAAYVVGEAVEAEFILAVGIWTMLVAMVIAVVGEFVIFLFAVRNADEEVKASVNRPDDKD